MIKVPAPREGLLSHQLGDQVVVYDTIQNRVHVLDATTAEVLTLLRRQVDAEHIAAALDEKVKGAGLELRDLAIDELRKAELTSEKSVTTAISDVTRRQMLQRLSVIGAAVFVPSIL